MSTVNLHPLDKWNLELLKNAHPQDRVDPKAQSIYNMVVIGAGTAGLITAAGTGVLGGKVALIERNLMGGDCLNIGCVPSKTIIRSAQIMANARDAQSYGIHVPEGTKADFPAVMERLRRVRADISHNDSVERYEGFGIDIFLGEGRFTARDTIEVNGQTLRFKKAVIATGSHPVAPNIPGLKEAGYLTNETVFNLTEQPVRLAVIGGGPIGSELAQAFLRLGSEVVLFHNEDHLLSREDAHAAEIVQQRFLREGMCLILKAKITRVEQRNGKKVLFYTRPQSDGTTAEGEVVVDEILVGAGRVPNVTGLNLEGAGVEYDTRKGVHVDDNLRTTNPNIFAIGDVAIPYKFTHMADATARIAIRNALFMGRDKLSSLIIPWVTYTDPEIAHVGLYEHEAQAQGIAIETFMVELNDNDRARAEGDDEGFVKVHVKKGTDTILGATIVARDAGNMISEITLAMVNGLGLGKFTTVIHPYPTQSEAIRRVADLHRRAKFTPPLQWAFKQWLALTR
ncbi:MAG: mercuric reductase [Chloroflexaceae bacterium]|nr:mercuric reductase [Chloroflexaceae bacterium]NJO05891.1 mercuric reductase [Chloroflexaceae bacterium]